MCPKRESGAEIALGEPSGHSRLVASIREASRDEVSDVRGAVFHGLEAQRTTDVAGSELALQALEPIIEPRGRDVGAKGLAHLLGA